MSLIWNYIEEQTKKKCLIRRWKWNWLGHTLRKPLKDITRMAIDWNPQGTRKKGRPKHKWRRPVESKAESQYTSRLEVKALIQNRTPFKAFVEAICSIRSIYRAYYYNIYQKSVQRNKTHVLRSLQSILRTIRSISFIFHGWILNLMPFDMMYHNVPSILWNFIEGVAKGDNLKFSRYHFLTSVHFNAVFWVVSSNLITLCGSVFFNDSLNDSSLLGSFPSFLYIH